VIVTKWIASSITSVIFMTAGTMLLMWLGEQITQRGIGNGVSLLITGRHPGRHPGARPADLRCSSSSTRSAPAPASACRRPRS
jgi:hypothetical protein